MDNKIAVIIVAAGNGKRMKTDLNKLFLDIDGKPVLAHTISRFYNMDKIDEIVVALNPKDIEVFEERVRKPYGFENLKIVSGGKDRQESSYNALKELDEETDIVLIHDGARPFVSEAVINDCIDKTLEYGAAVAALPASNTIKYSSDAALIDFTPPREKLFEAQTPQGFDYNLIKNANEVRDLTALYPATDDASIVELAGREVALSEGEKINIKITTPEDLIYAEALSKVL